MTCGSYRRGKPTCGDVDILVTHPDGRSHKGIFSRLIQLLKEDGNKGLNNSLYACIVMFSLLTHSSLTHFCQTHVITSNIVETIRLLPDRWDR